MPKIKPIKELRDTVGISKDVHNYDGPVFITKNGKEDMVIMSDSYYKSLSESGGTQPQDCCLGYLRVRAGEIDISIADAEKNAQSIIEKIGKAKEDKVGLLVLPELCLTGYTCGDLFLSQELLSKAEALIPEVASGTADADLALVFGAPLRIGNSLYNCAVVAAGGKIIGVVPKHHIPNYSEFYEKRYFSSYAGPDCLISAGCMKDIPFGNHLLFQDTAYLGFVFGAEICEDLWAPDSPNVNQALNGARVIVNISASDEVIGKADYRSDLVRITSAKLDACYVYSSCGKGESSQDLVYGGHKIIAEDGRLLAESELFSGKDITADVDLDKIGNSRRRNTVFASRSDGYLSLPFSVHLSKPDALLRAVGRNPFVISDSQEMAKRCSLVMRMQAEGLLQRMKSINCRKAVIGLSGGLDSTLALLAINETFELGGFDKKGIFAITLPSFGTTDLTKSSVYALASELNCTFREIPINAAVSLHFKDIGHNPRTVNAAYENSQARERTQILMDFANDNEAIMVGTGDLSEMCLGWTTYGGDHMSMYDVNVGIPKTLVRETIRQYGIIHPKLAAVLQAVLDTPISPELTPVGRNEKITQKTEEIVGPYELIDFFIYYFLRRSFTLEKILYLAEHAYDGKYGRAEIIKWLKVFVRRFFGAQFKRSCLPDGIKIGNVAISPRGDLRMPSDASAHMYLQEIERLEKDKPAF